MKRYPTMASLADADERELERILRPLGLFWRGKLLIDAARQIEENKGGRVPDNLDELRALPGVGNYISAAVSCFAYDIPQVLLDTNTVRVLGRVFQEPVSDRSRRSKTFHRLGSRLLDRSHPRRFNYALIDLAALVCRPKNPKCDSCPVQSDCMYGSSQRSSQ